MGNHFYLIDWIVLFAYFAGIMLLGFSFWKRSGSSSEFTSGGGTLPGWLCGLSIFATYLSSISYLALPGKSFAADWNSFVFSLSLPIAAFIAVKWFLPYYRSTGEVSAYAMLEHRFGAWARIYASSFYLVFQIARMGVVMYLMALPMAVIFGWDMRTLIVATGISVTVYAFVGGIVAVIWADAIQAIVLMLGAVIALVILLMGMPEGPQQVFEMASREHKFSLGSTDLFNVAEPTIWVVLVYGLVENLKNFGVDQSYIQRYIASRSEKEAARGVWLGALLYIPISAMFFFIGTSLFAFYHTNNTDIAEVKQIVAEQRLLQKGIQPRYTTSTDGKQILDPEYSRQVDEIASSLTNKDIGDRVFPHFIAKYLPPGVTGLLIAAIFAAAMSTVSTSLNSSATLVMSDFYQRFFRPDATERQLMFVLHLSTLLWGIFGTAMALSLVSLTESVLDVWWTLSSILGGGIVGLFLLGIISRQAGNAAAVTGVLAGSLVLIWMVVSTTDIWPDSLAHLQSPFHNFMTIVVGTLTILLVGIAASAIWKRSPQQQ